MSQDWTKALDGELGWLNCEFNDIDTWASKCLEEAQKGAKILLLTPLTTANWAIKYCFRKAIVNGLNPRLIFKGHTQSYPKDLMITAWNLGEPVTDYWCWKQ